MGARFVRVHIRVGQFFRICNYSCKMFKKTKLTILNFFKCNCFAKILNLFSAHLHSKKKIKLHFSQCFKQTCKYLQIYANLQASCAKQIKKKCLSTFLGKMRLPQNVYFSISNPSLVHTYTACNRWPSPPALYNGTVCQWKVRFNLTEEASAPSLFPSSCIIYLWGDRIPCRSSYFALGRFEE